MWGHGYVITYFDLFKEGVWLKRYRCSECGAVIRIRPKGYFPRFQSPIKTILRSISLKETKNKWMEGISRSRQLHWINAVRRRVYAVYGHVYPHSLAWALREFAAIGISGVSRAI